jgi:hypothetical protein
MKKWWKIFLLVVGLFFLLTATFYVTIVSPRTPSNDRPWAADQAVLPFGMIKDDEVEIKNIRHFTYRSTTDFDAKYYDKKFRLSQLESVWYIVEPFEGLGAAHTFLSFGFKDGSYVAISVEIRKEKGEVFSPWRGLLRHYELMYVIADERDLLQLRAIHRQDDVYLYPVKISPETGQELFLDMLARANRLQEKPEFYNTLTNSCTLNLARHVNKVTEVKVPLDIRLILPKNSDLLAQELRLLDIGKELPQNRDYYKINDKVESYANNSNFSTLIRE